MKHRCETAETEVLSLKEIVKLKDLQIKELQIEGLMHKTEMQSFQRKSLGASADGRSTLGDTSKDISVPMRETSSTRYASLATYRPPQNEAGAANHQLSKEMR